MARTTASAVVLASAAIAIFTACTEGPGTQYGSPSGLRHENLPGEAGAQALVCGADGGDAGASSGGGSGGACAVSWASDIFPNMKADGPWKCASTGKCHGGAQPPQIDASTASAAYDSLRSYTIANNPAPYINPDASDPSQSSIECNLQGSCGSGMPIDPGTPLTADQLCKIDVWVRCGAPNN